MAALAISAHLPFVQRDKGDFPVGGHGFRRAQEVARAFRQDFFFAGDERNLIAALYRDDPLIHLPREVAQGKADHSGSVTAHALDRKMGFAGVSRPPSPGHLSTVVATHACYVGETRQLRTSILK